MERVCLFNDNVICDHDECCRCGWHPEVAKARHKDLVRKMTGFKLYKVPFTGYCEVWARSLEEAAEKAEIIEEQFFASYNYEEPICLEKEDANGVDR